MKIKDLEQRVEELARDIAAFKKDDDWPQKGGKYWFVSARCCDFSIFRNDKYDQHRMRTGNMYRTKEDAQTVIDIENRIHELTGDWVANWIDGDQSKNFLCYGHHLGEWRYEDNTGWQRAGVTYMPKHAAVTILKEFTTEQLNLWGGVR